MDNYKIYDDGEMVVEIDGLFHMILEELQAPFVTIEPKFLQLLLSKIAQEIDDKKLAEPNALICCSNKAFLLSKGDQLSLKEPFKEFENGLNYICNVDNFNNRKESLAAEIKELYCNKENFLCEIYKDPLFGIDGFLCEIRDSAIYIVFFAYLDFL